MELLPEIRNRRSVRVYRPDEIPEPSLERVLEAARQAPSAKNRQAWRFIAITKPELQGRLQTACFGQEWVGQAPVSIAFCTTNVDYRMPNGQLSYPIDLSFAVAFAMLQAEHEGFGTCAISTFDEEDVKALLSVPHTMRVVLLLTIGYSAEDEDGPGAERLPFDRVVAYNHW